MERISLPSFSYSVEYLCSLPGAFHASGRNFFFSFLFIYFFYAFLFPVRLVLVPTDSRTDWEGHVVGRWFREYHGIDSWKGIEFASYFEVLAFSDYVWDCWK